MRRTALVFAAAFLVAPPLSAPSMAAGPKPCPPGLAKKGDCTPPGQAKKDATFVPPGQAKKRYLVGAPLPETVRYVPVPVPVARPAPPPGTLYGQVDGDILLIAEGTRRVIELIGIADALAN